MKQLKKLSLICGALLCLACSAKAAIPTLTLSASTQSIVWDGSNDQTITLTVSLSSPTAGDGIVLTNLNAYDIQLDYNAAVLSFSSAVYNTQLDGGTGSMIYGEYGDSVSGQAFTTTQLGSPVNLVGSFKLATFTFEVVGAGSANLSFDSTWTEISDSTGQDSLYAKPGDINTVTPTVVATPEPSTYALGLMAVAVIALVQYRRRSVTVA